VPLQDFGNADLEVLGADERQADVTPAKGASSRARAGAR
jgi:hypothetical protein